MFKKIIILIVYLIIAFLVIDPAYSKIIKVNIKGIDDGVKTTKQQDYMEAVLFAKREAIERAGVRIESYTSVKNLIVKKDYIEIKAEAVLLPGFEIIDMGYAADGSYQIVLIGEITVIKAIKRKEDIKTSELEVLKGTDFSTQEELNIIKNSISNSLVYFYKNNSDNISDTNFLGIGFIVNNNYIVTSRTTIRSYDEKPKVLRKNLKEIDFEFIYEGPLKFGFSFLKIIKKSTKKRRKKKGGWKKSYDLKLFKRVELLNTVQERIAKEKLNIDLSNYKSIKKNRHLLMDKVYFLLLEDGQYNLKSIEISIADMILENPITIEKEIEYNKKNFMQPVITSKGRVIGHLIYQLYDEPNKLLIKPTGLYLYKLHKECDVFNDGRIGIHLKNTTIPENMNKDYYHKLMKNRMMRDPFFNSQFSNSFRDKNRVIITAVNKNAKQYGLKEGDAIREI